MVTYVEGLIKEGHAVDPTDQQWPVLLADVEQARSAWAAHKTEQAALRKVRAQRKKARP
jgi:hypothetical protein